MDRNILFIIPSLSHGGAENQTVQQCNALYDRGWNVFLCVLTSRIPLLERVKLPEKHILILSVRSEVLSVSGVFARISDIKQLVSFAKSNNISRVVANLPLGHWYGRILKIFNSNILLYNYHRSLQYDANPQNTFPKKLFNSIQSGLANFTDNVSICISQAVKENIKKHFNLKNPVILYNSVPDRLSEFTNIPDGIKSHAPLTIVLPGRLHPSKGQLFFLSVLAQMSTRLKSHVEFVFAGGGSLEQEISQKIKEYGLTDIVYVTGFLKNKELLQQIHESDLVLIPSIHEGLGNVAIETLMLGKTMIVSDAGGLKEIVQHKVNGYMFERGNAEQLLQLMEQVVFNYPESLLPSERIRASYCSRFTIESHINKLISVIEQEKK